MAELIALEPIFHRLPPGATLADFDDVWQASDFRCQPSAPDLYLPTYTLLRDKSRLTRQTTIWKNRQTGWQIVFHQGTLVA